MPKNRKKKTKLRSKPKGCGQSSPQLGSTNISNQSPQLARPMVKPVDFLNGSFAITGPISMQALESCVTVTGASGFESVNFRSYRYASSEDIVAFEQKAGRDTLGLQTFTIMQHLILEYWLSAFFPVNLKDSNLAAYQWLIEAVEGRCADFSSIFSQDVTRMLSEESRIAHLLRRFVKGRDCAQIENIWEVPKNINMTDGVSHFGQDCCNFQMPFWVSDDFFLHAARKNRVKSYSDTYAFAWVDCMDIPLHHSRYQDHVIKHVAWAMQAYIDKAKKTQQSVRGGALILSGVPSQKILEWFMCLSRSRVKQPVHGSGGDGQEITSIPDIEVFLAVPALTEDETECEDIASRDVYFCVKSGIKPGLDCRNQIAYQGSYQCLQDRQDQLTGEELTVLLQNALLHYDKSVLLPYSVKNDLSKVCDARQTLYNRSQPVVLSSHGEADKTSLHGQPRHSAALKKFYAAFWHYVKTLCEKQPMNEQRQTIPENALLTVSSFFNEVSKSKAKKNSNRRKFRDKEVTPKQLELNRCHHFEIVRKHALSEGGYYPDWYTVTQDTCNENFYHNQEVNALSLSNLSEHLDELNGRAFWLVRPVIFRHYSDGVLRLVTPRYEQLSIFYDTSDDAVKWLRYVQLFLENLVILMMQVIPKDNGQQKNTWKALMGLNIYVASTPIFSRVIMSMVNDMITFLESKIDLQRIMQEPFFCTSRDVNKRQWFMLSDLKGPIKAKKDEALAILKKAQEVMMGHNPSGWADQKTFQVACTMLNEVCSSSDIPFCAWLNQVGGNVSEEGSFSCVDTHARPEEARTLFDVTDDDELVGALQTQDCTIGGFYDFSYVPENIIKCIFVLTTDGDMKIAQEFVHSSKRRISHVQLAEGKRVDTAGEMFFLKQQNHWVLHVINNGSGHYRPDLDSLSKPSLRDALAKIDVRIDQSTTRLSSYHSLYGYAFCQNRDAVDSHLEDNRVDDHSHVPKITV